MNDTGLRPCGVGDWYRRDKTHDHECRCRLPETHGGERHECWCGATRLELDLDHVNSHECWCRPVIEQYPNADVIIHNTKEEGN